MKTDAIASIERLRSLPARSNMLKKWYAGEPAESPGSSGSGAGVSDPAFTAVYKTLMSSARTDPGRALDAANHLRRAVHDALPNRERALLARLEGHLHAAAGQAKLSLDRYREAGRLFKNIGDRREEAKTTIGWVFALALVGNPREALVVARRGRRLLGGKDPVSRARLETNLGNAWHLAGQLDRAVDRYETALAEFRRAGSNWDAAVTAHNLSLILILLGQTKAARRHLEDAREEFSRSENRLLRLYSETILTALDLAAGDWESGVEAVASLREQFESLGDRRARGWLHRELSLLYASLGALEAALPESDQARRVFDDLGLEADLAWATFVHGRLLAARGNHQDALARLRDARRHFEKTESTWLIHRTDLEQARLLVSAGHFERALEVAAGCRSYLQKRDPNGDGALCRAVVAEAHLGSGRVGLALRMAREAHRSARNHPAKLERPWIALILAEGYSARGARTDALRWARRAVHDLEELLLRFGSRHLRLLVGGARDPVYGRAVELALGLGGRRAEETAVDFLSRARSPNLIEDLLQGTSESMRPETRAAIVRLRDEILSKGSAAEAEDARHAGLSRHLTSLEKNLDIVIRREPAIVRRALANRAFPEWRKKLGRRDVVLYDRVASSSRREQWRAFVVQSGGAIERVELPRAGEALRDAWQPLRLTLQAAAQLPRERREEFLARTQETSRALFEDVRSALWAPLPLESDRVVVVPVGALHSLPLEALGPERTVSRLPHPALLRSPGGQRNRNALLLHGGETGARSEVQRVARVLRGDGFSVRTGDRRRDLDRSDEPVGLLHVAAHGVFHRQGWLMSGMKLADGWLGFESLRRKQLRGALIQFASCDSGLTEQMPGSDIDGWIAAGLAAGARELLLTVWKIDDQSAGAFADSFYRLWAQEPDAAVAARHARAKVREELPHPYHWGPFVVVA